MPTPPSRHAPRIAGSYGPFAPHGDTMLTWDWARARLEAARNYWVAVTRADGRPHVTPVWGAWAHETLVFGSGRDSVKARAIARDARVAVHLDDGDNVVIVEGVAEELGDGPLWAAARQVFQAKYAFDPGTMADVLPHPQHVFWRLRPLVAHAWQEQAFHASAARFTFDDDDGRAGGPA